MISPPLQTSLEKSGYVFSQGGLPIQKVDFDVAVTAAEKTGTKGTIGVVMGAIGLGSQGESANSKTNDSRIKFSVPIALPVAQPNQSK
jgi:hypothetical protein